jgi:4-hydroxy-2-oxoheptanedioate aldolase
MVHEVVFMSEGKTIPWVRVPGHEHAAIGYALDAGASLVLPQINTVAEAQHCCSAAKFGTKQRGTRSAPPFRLIPEVTAIPINKSKTMHENLNDQAAIMIQIETQEGIDNLDDILTQVPDIDAVWLGTLDIRVSMNMVATGFPGPEEEYVSAVRKFEDVLRKHDMPRGGIALGDPEMVKCLGKDNALSFIAADVMALGGLAASLGPAREMFPAERKMRGGGEEGSPPW